MKTMLQRLSGALALAAVLAGCVNQQQQDIQTVDEFKRNTAGQYRSDNGAQLFIVPVRSRMVTDESMYIELHDANGIYGRLLDLKISADGEKVLQLALTFTQEGQWRNLRENPELFTALLPKDVRPAGTCDIQPAEDHNSVSYSCGGSKPEVFTRQ
ncbi:MAG TPA: hypothetical protein VNM71_12675 [Steroidobacteraceae bacterium]|nr:hypothetical protein [Steroidobacteraceae bacterium]